MSIYLRLFGGALLMLCALLVKREYSSYVKRRLATLFGFLQLLEYMEGEISKFLSFGEELWRGFSDPALESSGVLDRLREGYTPPEAIELCSDRLPIPEEQKSKLAAFFSDFGRGYREGEIERIREFKGELAGIYNTDRDTLEKNEKVTGAILLGGSLAAVIMII